MPEHRVRTKTSSGPGSGNATGRISPTPGERTQKARASNAINPPSTEPDRHIARVTDTASFYMITEEPWLRFE
jgi:hypothetical protein